jgi:hypothetical protein
MPRTRWLALVLLFGLLGVPTRAADLTPQAPFAQPAIMPLADTWDWDWDEFRKFWRKQFGKTWGVVGAVSLVVAVGALIVMSARKKT